MRECKLKIDVGEDFVIITPQMLSALISRIHRVPGRELVVAAQEIIPIGLAEYMEKVINTNRYTTSCFRYSYILEDPITTKELHQILRLQMEVLEMDQTTCFRSVAPADISSEEEGFYIICTEPFFEACKDSG